jgi:hypothetical protein
MEDPAKGAGEMAQLMRGRRWSRGGTKDVSTRRLRPARDVLTAEREGLTVLLDLRRGVYLGLDEAGTAIWREVEAGSTPTEVEARLCAQYDAPVEVVRDDVARFMAVLLRRGLVEAV